MKIFPILLIIFGIIIIINPDIIAYLIGGLFVFIGVNMIVFGGLLKTFQKKSPEGDYVQFGKYKIYK